MLNYPRHILAMSKKRKYNNETNTSIATVVFLYIRLSLINHAEKNNALEIWMANQYKTQLVIFFLCVKAVRMTDDSI